MPRYRPTRLHVECLECRTLMSTCHVTRLSDSGVGKGFRGDLRYCINKVNSEPGPDVIDFTVTGTINVTTSLPTLGSEIDIQGPGADVLTIRRNAVDLFRIFLVSGSVQMSGLTIENGWASGPGSQYGGGIYNLGNLIVVKCVITQNHVGTSSDLVTTAGGGIANVGSLTVIDTSIIANQVGGGWIERGAGIYNGGSGTASIYNSTVAQNFFTGLNDDYGGGVSNVGDGLLVIVNSTVYGNQSDLCAGGIYVAGAMTVISHSTISGNESACGGDGVFIDGAKPVFLRNTIVAGNSSGDISGTLASSGYNLVADSADASGFAPTDILDVDPLLGPLADNGGPTLTMALLPSSPAIDAGDNADAPEWDQRGPGFPRIVNGTIDIGAFEVQSSTVSSAPVSFAFLITADLQDEE